MVMAHQVERAGLVILLHQIGVVVPGFLLRGAAVEQRRTVGHVEQWGKNGYGQRQDDGPVVEPAPKQLCDDSGKKHGEYREDVEVDGICTVEHDDS